MPAESPRRRWIVRCPDGRVRHPVPFTDQRGADHWAQWGHTCEAEHKIEEWFDPDGGAGEISGAAPAPETVPAREPAARIPGSFFGAGGSS